MVRAFESFNAYLIHLSEDAPSDLASQYKQNFLEACSDLKCDRSLFNLLGLFEEGTKCNVVEVLYKNGGARDPIFTQGNITKLTAGAGMVLSMINVGFFVQGSYLSLLGQDP